MSPREDLGQKELMKTLKRTNSAVIALEAKVRTLLNAEIQSEITSDFLLTRSAILRLLYNVGTS